jgi:hypothetical protein
MSPLTTQKAGNGAICSARASTRRSCRSGSAPATALARGREMQVAQVEKGRLVHGRLLRSDGIRASRRDTIRLARPRLAPVWRSLAPGGVNGS